MDPVHASLAVYEGTDAAACFRGMAESIAGWLPLRCALLIDAETRAARERWPDDAEISPDLLDTSLHILRTEVLAIGSEFPFDSSQYRDAEMLAVPLRDQGRKVGVVVLIADEGAFGEDVQSWERVGLALQSCDAKFRRIADGEVERDELRRRVEETEALHTLGLAANRTLDKDEVLNLVARFARTLLGAHYVTVNTVENGRTFMAASVGLRDPERGNGDYHLARLVVEAEKPLTIGEPGAANLEVEHFPLHAAEGMRVGLGIPLTLFGDTFGSLILGYRDPYEIAPRDVRLGLTLASHAAVAISNARLHERVEQRSEELERAYAELNRLTEAKERFFASINHELRNPLGAILGYLDLVLEGTGGPVPDAALAYLKKSQRAATTLKTLVNDLLDLSKIAAGKMEVELAECSVATLVDGVLNTIQPLADEKGVPLEMAGVEEAPPLRTDLNRAQQVLVNLLSNAVKFTPAGGQVRLSVEPADDGAWIDIRVIDTGPGIAPDALPLIFEEYEQVKGTKGGTGLGLPISRRLARLLGGELEASSEPGVGSTFTLTLPCSVPAG